MLLMTGYRPVVAVDLDQLLKEKASAWLQVSTERVDNVDSVKEPVIRLLDAPAKVVASEPWQVFLQPLIEPFQSIPLSKVVLTITLVATLLYLLLVVPAVSTTVSIVMAAILVMAFSAVQVICLLRYSLWLNTSAIVTLLVPGMPVMIWWSLVEKRSRNLSRQLLDCQLELVGQYRKSGQLDDAVAIFEQCATGDSTIALGCELADQLQSQRRYQAAAQLYQSLLSKAPKCPQAINGLANLRGLLPGAAVATANLSATQQLTQLPDSTVVSTVIGRYQIERELGRGAMGVVYLGKDPKIGRTVAIKTVSLSGADRTMIHDLKTRFFREAEAAGRLSHPNIVTVFDAGEEHDLAYIAMDYVQGEPLSQHVNKASLLPCDDVYRVIADVADALDYAHRKNIIHRDIKPANLLYNGATGAIKVSDFGIARISDDSHTRTGDILGSPLYMSPELFSGKKATTACDIYSLGVTFYQLLTGAVPYQADSLAQLAYQVMQGRYRSVRELRPQLPAAAVRIINKAMNKDAAKRYETAAEMAQLIRKNLLKKQRQVA